MTNLSNEIPRNEPRLDSIMFIQHNITQWQEPADLTFEPSPIWHDDDVLVTDETAKVFLRNLLTKSKAQLRELKMESDKKRREVENAKRLRENVRQGKEDRDEVEVVKSIIALQEALHETDRKRLTCEVETSTIISAAGDLSLGARNHNFKAQTFKIPTNCDLCGERIWGLSAKGFDCRDCGYTCHSKCEMKVPAECPGEISKEEKKKLKAERQELANATPVFEPPSPNGASESPALSRRDTMSSLSSGYAASATRTVSGGASKPTTETTTESSASSALAKKPTTTKRNRIVAPPPAQYISPPPADEPGPALGSSGKSNEPKGKMLYPYQANGEGEITVDEGQDVTIVEPDGKLRLLIDVSTRLTSCRRFWLDARSSWCSRRSCACLVCGGRAYTVACAIGKY